MVLRCKISNHTSGAANDGMNPMTVLSVQGGSMGVLPGHVADDLQRSGASSGPDEGPKNALVINIRRSRFQTQRSSCDSVNWILFSCIIH